MFIWVVKQVILSLTLILLIHYLYFFFKTNLTEPKIKDLVNEPIKRYMEIYNTIEKPKSSEKEIDQGQMKDELKNYLKTLSNNTEITGTANAFSSDHFNTKFQTL